MSCCLPASRSSYYWCQQLCQFAFSFGSDTSSVEAMRISDVFGMTVPWLRVFAGHKRDIMVADRAPARTLTAPTELQTTCQQPYGD
eukprot:119674-Amphidinium_carterae.1